MTTLQMKMVSSLEKCFWDDPIESKQQKNQFVMFENERLSFQVMYRATDDEINLQRFCPVRIGGALAPYAKVRQVANILNVYPTYNVNPGGAFLRTTPGAYPDLLRPFIYDSAVPLPNGQTNALWVDIELPEGFAAGKYDISLSIWLNDEERLAEVCGEVEVIAVKLPPQKLIHTEWFYTDCIANYYHVKAFSEKHWKLIESFMRTAGKNGINMILTPIFTPELDTYIGGERLTTQLVDIELVGKDKYAFDFKLLHRWIDLCLDCGIEYFEIPHFFTQWGSKAAPKIVVKVNGKKKKYFGWHTDSMGEQYKNFLSQFIPAIIAEFKTRGLDKKLFFHVSDEPSLKNLEQYKKCKELIAPFVEGYPIIDALSKFEFYEMGILKKPVPSTRHTEPFLKAGIEGLWVYYCGGGKAGVSDRSVSMPSERTRILGVQLYYFDIEGFLHWGYNFYNSCRSHKALDPFCHPDTGYFMPTGDSFLVYPGEDGEAWESLRLNALREAMDDIRALRLYEERFGRDAAKALILEGFDGEFTFMNYPQGAEYLLNLREKIANALKN